MIDISPHKPVIIAGPTASGKSALALHIAEMQGGVIVNADASQVFQGWPILTAQPDADDLTRARHVLYGHAPYDKNYTLADWLADIPEIINSGERPIIVGGTGLYLTSLTQGISQIPQIPSDVRAQSNLLDVAHMLSDIDDETKARIDINNPRRVQRAWEVQQHTGHGLSYWHQTRDPAILPEADTTCLVLDAPKDWLNPRIAKRFDMMMDAGLRDEARQMEPHWQAHLQSSKAIGAQWMIAHLRGEMDLETVAEKIIIATRQYAKRQRTWFRANMAHWAQIPMSEGQSVQAQLRLL